MVSDQKDSAKYSIALNRAVSDFCLRNASRCLELQSIEDALQWNLLAARILAFECTVLTSPELENQLLTIARQIPVPTANHPKREKNKKKWLHVLTEVCKDGGHGNTVRRWIEKDSEENRHCIVLLGQKSRPVPESLIDVVQRKGGAVIRMDDPQETLISRATRLRELVWSRYDVVVLHVHPWDITATVALGVPGGPPVLLLNHGAHTFWVGCSIADVIIDIRNSAEEDEWTVKYRGVDRIMHLPIPLPEPEEVIDASGTACNARIQARKSLGVPENALVLLTVGNDYKYKPVAEIDFLKAVEPVLARNPHVYLLAAGPMESENWRKLSEATGGRVLAFGVQADLSAFHAAADVYLEGFPFGSTTSLLEAGLKGIPVVLPPKICPPPFVTDGASVEILEQASDMEDYVEKILELLTDKQERQRQGEMIRHSIRNHHCGKGWLSYLEELKKSLPSAHRIYPVSVMPPVPERYSVYWSGISNTFNANSFGLVVNQIMALSLRPEMDRCFLKFITSREAKSACDKASCYLMTLGDHYYQMQEYHQALQCYQNSIKTGPFLLAPILKYILLLFGRPGIKFREDLCKIKNYFRLVYS